MPWDCEGCGVQSPDDLRVCPACGHQKSAWTVVQDQTRALVLPRKKLEVRRGVSAVPLAAAPAWDGLEAVDAEEAPVSSKVAVRDLLRGGRLPAPKDVLLARLSPGGEKSPVLSITIGYAGQAQETLERPQTTPAGLPSTGSFVVPVVLVFGEGDSPVIDGVEVVDVSEAGATHGVAPEVELAAFRRPPVSLPTRPAAPPPPPAIVAAGALFPFDSAFPTPGIEDAARAATAVARAHPTTRFAVFGHADPAGSKGYNKKLSDRRAQAVVAMLTGDVALLSEVAKDDDWGPLPYKAMLRVLGCDPGPLVAGDGANQQRAVREFQVGWNLGYFHSDAAPRTGADLAEDGDLGPKSKAALIDAYVRELAIGFPADRLLAPAGSRASGCSEFNQVSDVAVHNRRVVIAVLEEGQAPAPADFPCREGKSSACPVDSERPSCPFYRRHVDEARAERPILFPLWDSAWLPDAEDPSRVHLSAITTLTDGPATFTVLRCSRAAPTGADSSGGEPPPDLGPTLAVLQGVVTHGVAFATWTPPAADHPFDLETWRLPGEIDPAAWDDLDRLASDEMLSDDHPLSSERLAGLRALAPPVFRVEVVRDGVTVWADSGPPGVRADRLRIFGRTGDVVALASDGSHVHLVVGEDGQVEVQDERAPEDVLVLALLGAGAAGEDA